MYAHINVKLDQSSDFHPIFMDMKFKFIYTAMIVVSGTYFIMSSCIGEQKLYLVMFQNPCLSKFE